ncbi:MAG: hypothetical protein [Cressdnaviricota sp.]|nr:MAG: hypothetical protein [Cressdnaviricota sp.]
MHNSSITFLHYHYLGMDRGFIPADKVLYEMRRAAMADFMRLWNGEGKRQDIGDETFWAELHAIAKKCKGEGERKRYRFGLKRLNYVQERLMEWGRVDNLEQDEWSPKHYGHMLKSCSEEFYQKILWREKIDRIAASLIRNGEHEFTALNWAATQIEKGKDIPWEKWKNEALGITEEYEDPNEENPFLQ